MFQTSIFSVLEYKSWAGAALVIPLPAEDGGGDLGCVTLISAGICRILANPEFVSAISLLAAVSCIGTWGIFTTAQSIINLNPPKAFTIIM